MLLRPWPTVEPTATPAAVEAICARGEERRVSDGHEEKGELLGRARGRCSGAAPPARARGRVGRRRGSRSPLEDAAPGQGQGRAHLAEHATTGRGRSSRRSVGCGGVLRSVGGRRGGVGRRLALLLRGRGGRRAGCGAGRASLARHGWSAVAAGGELGADEDDELPPLRLETVPSLFPCRAADEAPPRRSAGTAALLSCTQGPCSLAAPHQERPPSRLSPLLLPRPPRRSTSFHSPQLRSFLLVEAPSYSQSSSARPLTRGAPSRAHLARLARREQAWLLSGAAAASRPWPAAFASYREALRFSTLLGDKRWGRELLPSLAHSGASCSHTPERPPQARMQRRAARSLLPRTSSLHCSRLQEQACSSEVECEFARKLESALDPLPLARRGYSRAVTTRSDSQRARDRMGKEA